MKFPKIQIAIAEDKKEDLETIVKAVENLPNYEVVIKANCGKMLIKELHKLKQQPSLILMDMQMPSCDGLTATIVCKHINPSQKIVGLSTHTYESVICEFMAEGGNGFLSKFIVQSKSAISKFTYHDENIFSKALHKIIVEDEIYFDPLCHYTGKGYEQIVSTKTIFSNQFRYLSYEQVLLLHLNQATFSQSELSDYFSLSIASIKRRMCELLRMFNAQNHSDLVNITQMLNLTKTVKLFQMYNIHA
jgi:DNA-binding NarL/FixJ family response regulator